MSPTAAWNTAPMRLAAILGLFLIAALGGCSKVLPESVGPNSEILVLADPSDWEILRGPLQDTFEKVLLTPQEEKVYSLQLGDVAHFETQKHNRRHTLLVVSPVDATHPVGEFVRQLLAPQVQEAVRQGRGAVSWKRDVWAQGQILIILSGIDLAAITDNIRMEADRLYRAVDEARNDRVKALVYQYGERRDVEAQLRTEYGWSVQVPFGYRILEAYPDSGFVVLVKQDPNRWLWVYWEDGVPPDQLTPDWCIAKRDTIARRFFDGDRISPGDTEVGETVFAGKLAVSMTGLWENNRTWSGGPFKTYAFVDVDLDRLYVIDVGVFAPNKYKEPYLRQVDLVAQTFTYGDGPQTALVGD